MYIAKRSFNHNEMENDVDIYHVYSPNPFQFSRIIGNPRITEL